MTASYDYDCVPSRSGVSIGVPSGSGIAYVVPSHNIMVIEFVELTDRSGRKAAVARYPSCNLIAVDILPATNGDGASGPTLSPNLPNLGCDYPPISIRLQESGTPILSIRVTAAGEAENVQLITSSGKQRLDDAAIKLAQQQLKFIPSIREGSPVDAVREVAVTFHILHPIQGTPGDGVSVAFRCRDGKYHVFSCYSGRSTISHVPARRSLPLRLTSSDIKDGNLAVVGDTSPALNWSAGPFGTRSYVLIAESAEISGGKEPALFWIVLDIPSSAIGLPQGVPHDLRVVIPAGASNALVRPTYFASRVRPGYRGGVCRNCGGDFYRSFLPVRFQIFALDTKLDLDPLTVDREKLIDAMKDHVLASGDIVAR
jgi:TonB family protein